jgi:predicted negative regulator of RcsB-dependent stress response
MAAPTVTRPLASVADAETQARRGLSPDTEKWVKRAIVAILAAGVIALIVVVATSWAESSRVSKIRSQWDVVYLAIKEVEKKTPDEKAAALKAAADKVPGSSAQAYALMQAGSLNFQEGRNSQKTQAQRRLSLDKALALYEEVLKNEQFKKNAAFGPLAAEHAALVHAQRRDYDAAIKTLSENMPEADHFLYNKLQGEMAQFYFLRATAKEAEGKDASADKEKVREKISLVRTGVAAKKEKDPESQKSLSEYDRDFLETLGYIESKISKPGKALKDGKAPPVKAAPADDDKKEDTKKEGAADPVKPAAPVVAPNK